MLIPIVDDTARNGASDDTIAKSAKVEEKDGEELVEAKVEPVSEEQVVAKFEDKLPESAVVTSNESEVQVAEPEPVLTKGEPAKVDEKKPEPVVASKGTSENGTSPVVKRSIPEKVLRAALSIVLLPFSKSQNGEAIFSAHKRTLIQGVIALATTGLLDFSSFALAECSDCPAIISKVFMDISLDGEPAGRIIIGLYGNTVPIGAKRFQEISAGKKGVSYRKRDFVKVTPTYIQNSGLRSFALGAEVAYFTGGFTSEELVKEMKLLDDQNVRPKCEKGSVSIVVTDPTKPPASPKLLARDGKFELIFEESKPDPNGTEFCIAFKDAPELDATNLVVGKVVDGLEVVERIASTRIVEDKSNNPYFRTAKLIGDRRAVVAERGFNRPYSKIVVSKCGLLED